jgi:hypothetical protein
MADYLECPSGRRRTLGVDSQQNIATGSLPAASDTPIDFVISTSNHNLWFPFDIQVTTIST